MNNKAVKKILSYVGVIGGVWGLILFSISSSAGAEYADYRRIGLSVVFSSFSLVVAAWFWFPLFFKTNALKLKFIPKVFISLLVGLLLIVLISIPLVFVFTQEEVFTLILENPYLFISWLVGSLTAYYSMGVQ